MAQSVTKPGRGDPESFKRRAALASIAALAAFPTAALGQTPASAERPQEKQAITPQEALQYSKNPPSVVIHYNDSNSGFEAFLSGQVKVLRELGYNVVMFSGYKEDGVQLYVNGLTAHQLKLPYIKVFNGTAAEWAKNIHKEKVGQPTPTGDGLGALL